MSVDPTEKTAALWVESMHQLFVLTRGVDEHGGISAVGAHWHVATKILVSAELERGGTLGEWASQLSQEAARLSAPPGSGEAPPPVA